MVLQFFLLFISNLYYSLSLFVPVCFFLSISEKRDNFKIRLIVPLVLLLLQDFLPALICTILERTNFISGNIDMVLFFFSRIFIAFILSRFCYKQSFMNSIYCVICGYCIQHIWGRTADYIFYKIFQPYPQWCLVFRYSIPIIVLFVLCLVLYNFVIRRLKSDTDYAKNKSVQMIVSSIVLVFNNFMSAFTYEALNNIENKMDVSNLGVELNIIDWYISFLSVLTAGLCLFILLFLNRFKRSDDEKQLLERMLQDQKKKYENDLSNINLVNIKCHDLKHQLSASRGMLSQEQIDQAIEAVNIYDSTFRTGNEAVDVVLASKTMVLKNKEIRLSCMLEGESLSYIPSYEIYSLFGNALDNAIESVSLLPVEKRSIHISSERMGNSLVVKVKNYFSGNLEFKDGLPLTTHDDRNVHGFGTMSMRVVMEKYGGTMRIDIDNDVFILSLIFFPPSFQG